MLDVPFLADLITLTLRDTPFPAVEKAVPLLLGTAAVESHLQHTTQLGGGPALGWFQMEPATGKDLHHWLLRHPWGLDLLEGRAGVKNFSQAALHHRLPYQILLARTLFYVRDPQPMPDADDREEQFVRYKKYYNTTGGATTREKYLEAWAAYITPHWGPVT